MEELTITTVADPMMGMLWETWPVHRKLETHFGDQIEFRNIMGELVKDVYDFVDPNVERVYGKNVALNQYWTKLMQIYLQEESISGMPIYMGGNKRLFDKEHTSSIPMNLALRAIADHDAELEDKVLYEMQYDTVVNNDQTNDVEYLTKLANKFDIDSNTFISSYKSSATESELEQEQKILEQMKIDQLPAYLLTYDGKTYVVKGIPRYSEWLNLIKQVTDGKLQSQEVEFNRENVNKFINKHPHISSLELKEVFDVDEDKIIEMLKDDDSLDKTKVKETIFYRKK